MEIILTILVAFAVGGISGIFGLGGGFILVPVLATLLGFPMNYAVGSAACYVLGPATTSLLYRDVNIQQWRLPLIIGGGLFIGVLGGSALISRLAASPEELVRKLADYLVMGTYVLMLTVLGIFSVWESWRAARYRPLPRGWITSVLIPPVVRLSEWDDRTMSLPVLAWFGILVGFLSGMLGISGGLLLFPGLLYLFALPAQQSVVCSMILVWIVAFQSTIAHAMYGNIRLDIVCALLAGGTIGARLGTSLGLRLGSQELRKSFGYLALGTSLFVLVQLIFMLKS